MIRMRQVQNTEGYTYASELQDVLLHFWLIQHEIGSRVMRCGTSTAGRMGSAIKSRHPMVLCFNKPTVARSGLTYGYSRFW